MINWTRRMEMAICCVFFGFFATVSAQAQSRFSVVDTPSITVGSNVTAGNPGYQGYYQGIVGSISSPTTFDGYTIVAFADNFRGGKVGGYFATVLKISGFSADPGKAWLTGAQANGLVFAVSSATYTYSAGQANWSFGGGPIFEKANPAPTFIAHGGQGVDIGPKYQILGVDYAPPGQHSTVSYNNSAMQGTSTSTVNTWTNTTGFTATLESGASLAGILHGTITAVFSTSYAQETDANSSIAISTTTSRTDTVQGPASSAVGVDHDYDVVWVWLNPIASYVVGPNKVRFTGYAFNAADDAQIMEVVPLYVYWLKNPSTIRADVAARLARSWDAGGLGGLTATDYANILAADPFSSVNYNPSTDPGHRFDLASGQSFNYEPPPPGGQPITENFSVATQTTSSSGQGAMTTNTTAWSVEFKTGANVLAEVQSDFKVSNMYTTTSKWSSAINSATGKMASFSITGPTTADNYTGPVIMQVWRDNIYGSFMFVPVP
jgi:hypothetical protein